MSTKRGDVGGLLVASGTVWLLVLYIYFFLGWSVLVYGLLELYGFFNLLWLGCWFCGSWFLLVMGWSVGSNCELKLVKSSHCLVDDIVLN